MMNGKDTCSEFEKNSTSPNHEYIFSSTRNEGKSCSGIPRGNVDSTIPEGLVESTQTAWVLRLCEKNLGNTLLYKHPRERFYQLYLFSNVLFSNLMQSPCDTISSTVDILQFSGGAD